MPTGPLYVIVWKEGKYYVSQCLNVDVSSFGETRDEAVRNVREAVDLYFEDEHGQPQAMIEEPEILSVPLEHA